MRSTVKVLLTVVLFASPVAVDAKDRQARLIAETVDLFKAVLRDREAPLSPCLFPSTWGTYLLEASDFRHHLGARNTFRSRLTKQPPPLDEILTQAGAPKESICTLEQRKEAAKAARAALVSRSPETEAVSSLSYLKELDYNFPIYNARYSKAVIMLTTSASGWRKEKDGRIHALGGMSGALLVYGKRRGKWESLDYEEVFWAD